jgi:hypothetical protein
MFMRRGVRRLTGKERKVKGKRSKVEGMDQVLKRE